MVGHRPDLLVNDARGAIGQTTVEESSPRIGCALWNSTFSVHCALPRPCCRARGDRGLTQGDLRFRRTTTAEDMADCIVWVASRPSSVNIDLLVVRPRVPSLAVRDSPVSVNFAMPPELSSLWSVAQSK